MRASLMALVVAMSLLSLAVHCSTTVHAAPTPTPVIGLMCADDGTYSGEGELSPIVRASRIVRNVTIPLCQSAVELLYTPASSGTGGSVRLLVVTTGINAVNAAACTASMTSLGSYAFTSILWAGTSGWSPLRGWGMDPTSPSGCDAMQNDQTATQHAIGSVCITASAIDLSCGMCVSRADVPATVCRTTDCGMQNATQMFGECRFHGAGAVGDLAAQLTALAKTAVTFPPMPAALGAGEQQWWRDNQYMAPSMRATAPTVPSVYGPDECLEAGMNEIRAGQDMDWYCRWLGGQVLGRGAADTPCVAAMEGPGFARVILQRANIPFAILRGASNYNQYPVSQNGADPQGTPLWRQNTSYVTPQQHDNFVVHGYHYAIATTNAIIMAYLALQV